MKHARAALNTLAASGWKLVMARLFWARIDDTEHGKTIRLERWLGKEYLIDAADQEELT